MTTSIDPRAEVFLSNLQQIQDRMSTAEQQLSSGLRVSVASDAPDQISSILQLRAQIAGVQQTQENVSSVTPQVTSGETAIQQAIQVLDTATALATQAAGSTSGASQRQDEIPQVKGILQQLVSLSQTMVNGQYIFSGDLSGQPQYTLAADGNSVQPPAVQAGPPPQIADTNGVMISIGRTAQQVFDAQDGNNDSVFAAVTGLLTALQSNSSTDVQTALGNIQAASAQLNDESSFYGAAQNNLTAAGNAASQSLVQLQQQLSNEQDADAAQAAMDLTTASTDEQAAMSAQAMLKPQNLFSYLG